MQQLSVDVYNQIAVSFVELLEHLSYLAQRPLRTQRRTFISITLCPLCSLCEIFNAVGIHEAARSIHGTAGGSQVIAPELRSLLDDTVEMRSFLPLRHTSVWPRCRRCHANPAARKIGRPHV